MHSSNLKPEERDQEFNAESFYTLKFLVDVEKQVYKKYLSSVDKENQSCQRNIYSSINCR